MAICACKIDGDKVVEPCLAHVAWAREYCKRPQPKVHDVEEFYKEPDEWEAWANEFAQLMYMSQAMDWENANKIKAHLLKMPRGK